MVLSYPLFLISDVSVFNFPIGEMAHNWYTIQLSSEEYLALRLRYDIDKTVMNIGDLDSFLKIVRYLVEIRGDTYT